MEYDHDWVVITNEQVQREATRATEKADDAVIIAVCSGASTAARNIVELLKPLFYEIDTDGGQCNWNDFFDEIWPWLTDRIENPK